VCVVFRLLLLLLLQRHGDESLLWRATKFLVGFGGIGLARISISVGKRRFLRDLSIKSISLPRLARDTHRGVRKLRNTAAFFLCRCVGRG
jgi:hypothetical protein